MKATDFNMEKDLKFNIKTGITSFKDTRLVILSADSLGLLRQKILKEMGFDKAKNLFFKFGFQHGYSDFMQMKLNYKFDSEMDLLASGPTIHTWEGLVQATPKEIKFDRKTGEFYFTGVWTNSYEAQQHLCYNKPSKEPICWSLMGYASGWSTAFFGSTLICIEPVCMGKGDDHCEWKIQPPAVWGNAGKSYLNAIKEVMKRR
ncbi:MAG: XylR N-terminal domain-containing protein [archaeon]